MDQKFNMKITVYLAQRYWFWVAQLVEALRYKPEGRGFECRNCHWDFSLTNLSGRTMTLGST
jgi:hypothetical protein